MYMLILSGGNGIESYTVNVFFDDHRVQSVNFTLTKIRAFLKPRHICLNPLQTDMAGGL